MKKISLLIFTVVLFFCANKMQAQDDKEVQLLGPTFSSYMNLTEIQKIKIDSVIEEIKGILSAQKARFDEMRKKRDNGEQLDRDEMMKMRDQRDKEVKIIKADIEKIKTELTAEQLEKFSSVKLPDLEMKRPRRP